MRKDYYNLLGVSDEEKKLSGKDFEKVIKPKYRKLAMKYHPDKQQGKSDKEKKEAEDKFKEISEAYEVLSNEEKRAKYDNPMGDMGGMNFDFGGSGFEDIMSHFGFDFGGGMHRETVVKGQSMRINIGVTLEDLFNGVKKTIKYNRYDKCHSCHGTGKKSDSREEICSHCGGTGQLFSEHHGWQQITTCPHCKGSGKILKNPCGTCGGSGLEESTHQVELNIPKGVGEGYQMMLRGEGNAPAHGNGEYGDLLVLIRELPHNKFTRNGSDLYFTIEVPVIDALLGCDIEVTTIDNKKLNTKIPQGVEDGTNIRFVGKGLPVYNNPSRFGNMIGVVKIIMPKKLSSSDKNLLLQLKNSDSFK